MVERFYQYEGNEGLATVSAKVGAWLNGYRPASMLLIVKGLSPPDFACELEATVYLGKK